MKESRNIKQFGAVMLLWLLGVLYSCEKIENTSYEEIKDSLETERPPGTQSGTGGLLPLGQLLAQTDSLAMIGEAIASTNLAARLESEGPITLFAPTNAAIEELFAVLGDGYNSFDDFDTFLEMEALTRILAYHMVPENLDSQNIVDGERVTLYDGNTIGINISDNVFAITDATTVAAKVILKDQRAKNGVLHVIDKILVPQDAISFLGVPNVIDPSGKTIEELILDTEEYSLLADALRLTGLLDTLGEEGPYTVFAPQNDAILRLLGLLGEQYGSLDDFTGEAEIQLLRDILLYHVLDRQIKVSDFVPGRVNTLSSDNTLQIIEEGGEFALVDGLLFEAKFKTTDIPAKNGVVHTIDRILVPESVVDHIENEVALAIESAMISTGDLNYALEFFKAVQDRMDLEALAGKAFTFFFPSDNAFLELFDQLGPERVRNLSDAGGLELIKLILSYHCVEDIALKAADFTDQQVLKTFQGEELEVRVDQGVFILDKTGDTAKVIEPDVQVLNGYIHIVDKILIPEEVLEGLMLGK